RDLSISRVRFDHRANAVEFGLQRFGEDCCTRLSRLARVPQDEDHTFALMRKDSAAPHGWLQRNCRDRAERTSAQAPLLRRRSAMPYVPGYRVTSLQRVPLQDRRRACVDRGNQSRVVVTCGACIELDCFGLWQDGTRELLPRHRDRRNPHADRLGISLRLQVTEDTLALRFRLLLRRPNRFDVLKASESPGQ